ncbi:MAG: hypothetical protein CFE23_07635 [Flavobacterium sp. BFFFF1]|nr:MAG: hypothetical protein CFE23_07635 [Flavobacterium sp. BFFFF1]
MVYVLQTGIQSFFKTKQMKKTAVLFLTVVGLLASCKTTGTMAAIQPKSGTMELPAQGEFRTWKGLIHPSFKVTLSNSSATQSCEVYKVTENGKEKWVSPSLKAAQTMTVTVPSNGHLFFKNFNNNVLKINYQVEE